MKFGVCGGMNRLPSIIEAGYDYIELNLKNTNIYCEDLGGRHSLSPSTQ